MERQTRTAFTLIEILVVVVILGVLAGIVIPQFVTSTDEAVETTVRTQLSRVREAIEYYKSRNMGQVPADVTVLVNENYLQREPTHPGAASYVYDAATGEIQSPLDLTW